MGLLYLIVPLTLQIAVGPDVSATMSCKAGQEPTEVVRTASLQRRVQ